MQYLKRLIFSLFFLLVVLSCNKRVNQEQKDYYIKWDNSSLVCISDEGAYPRLIRLSEQVLLAVYENGKGDVVLNRSYDEGLTWLNEIVIYEAFDYNDIKSENNTRINIANPEIVLLTNGDLLLAVNLRPGSQGVFPYSIALKRSRDNGNTWSDADILYQAEPLFRDGCWEPSFLLLPDSTIQIYFANESPYQDSDEQEISIITSRDNGYTWDSEPGTVSFREGHRDGMPVAIHDGELIYVAIEDNVSGQFKPWIVKSSINSFWKDPVIGDTPNRFSALKVNLHDTVYAGAPYMIKTDNDIYLMSYQTTLNRSSNWEKSTMEVVVSNKPCNFRNPTQPFNVPLHKEAKWSSLADLGNNRVAAIASTNFNSDKVGIWLIKGEIIFE